MNQQALFDTAFAFHQRGLFADAEENYHALLTIEPDHIAARHYFGVLKFQQGSIREGLNLIKETAVVLDKTSTLRYNDLGNLLVQVAEFDQAIQAFQSSLRLKQDDAVVWNNLASVFHSTNQHESAEHAYRTALTYDEYYVPALNNLARLLLETGREEESSLLSCLAYTQPPMQDKPLKVLAFAYYRLGKIVEATDCYRKWLDLEPDNTYAKLHLAACTGQDVPDKAPEDYITGLYDDMAVFFDNKLVSTLSYSGPQIIADLLDGVIDKINDLVVLDAGCGTGLIAPILLPYAHKLIGVDLSSGMLAKAKSKHLYHTLVEADLMYYLADCSNQFDLIAMADTLIYFGDLAEVMVSVKNALRVNGLFVFTIENQVDWTHLPRVNYSLNPTGRYSHHPDYVRAILRHSGFVDVAFNEVILRTEFGKAILGIGVRAIKHA